MQKDLLCFLPPPPPWVVPRASYQPILSLGVNQNKAVLSREGNFISTCLSGWMPLDSI